MRDSVLLKLPLASLVLAITRATAMSFGRFLIDHHDDMKTS